VHMGWVGGWVLWWFGRMEVKGWRWSWQTRYNTRPMLSMRLFAGDRVFTEHCHKYI
jgi:hypothetical protein